VTIKVLANYSSFYLTGNAADPPRVDLLCEKIQGNGLTHGAISCGRRMQVITAIVEREHLVGVLRIGDHLVEIDLRIELSRRSNPMVHGLPIGFA
jgi:hypothetical protein